MGVPSENHVIVKAKLLQVDASYKAIKKLCCNQPRSTNTLCFTTTASPQQAYSTVVTIFSYYYHANDFHIQTMILEENSFIWERSIQSSRTADQNESKNLGLCHFFLIVKNGQVSPCKPGSCGHTAKGVMCAKIWPTTFTTALVAMENLHAQILHHFPLTRAFVHI